MTKEQERAIERLTKAQADIWYATLYSQEEQDEDIKIVLNLIKQLQEEKVQANERCKQLESKEQKIKKKLEEKIEMLEDVLDLCETDGKIAKYKIDNLKEEISDFKEILEIMKGEN